MPNVVLVGAQWGDEGKKARSPTSSLVTSTMWCAIRAATMPATLLSTATKARFAPHSIRHYV